MEKAAAEHQIALDKKQTTLDSMSTQFIQIKKDNAKLTKDLNKETEKVTLLEKKEKELTSRVNAHLEFARENFAEDSSAMKMVSMTEELAQLKDTVKEKELQITNLEKEASNNVKNKHILNLKTQLNAHEIMASEVEDEQKVNKRQLVVVKAEYEREKELNTLLLRNINACTTCSKKHSNVFTKRMDQSYNTKTPSKVSEKDTSPDKPMRKDRGPCFHELKKKGSCKYNRCMFSHTIQDGDRTNSELIQNIQKKISTVERKRTEDISSSSCSSSSSYTRKEHFPRSYQRYAPPPVTENIQYYPTTSKSQYQQQHPLQQSNLPMSKKMSPYGGQNHYSDQYRTYTNREYNNGHCGISTTNFEITNSTPSSQAPFLYPTKRRQRQEHQRQM